MGFKKILKVNKLLIYFYFLFFKLVALCKQVFYIPDTFKIKAKISV